MEKEKESFVYMVKCEDGSLYTGITKDIRQRMYDHYFKTEKAAKYTKSHKIGRIMMVWEAESYASAARLEYAIKRLSRRKKVQLIKRPEENVGVMFPKLAEEQYTPRREFLMNVEELLGVKAERLKEEK